MQIGANKFKKHYLHDAISRLANTHKTPPLIKQNSWPPIFHNAKKIYNLLVNCVILICMGQSYTSADSVKCLVFSEFTSVCEQYVVINRSIRVNVSSFSWTCPGWDFQIA